MAADDLVIEADTAVDATPSLAASLGPLPVVEIELVSVSASPAQSGGWAKTTNVGATLRVVRGDNAIFTARTPVAPREGSHKTGYHVAFRHTTQLFMDDTTRLRVSLRRPVEGGFAVVATATVEWCTLFSAMAQVQPVPDAFTIVPLTYTSPAAGFAGSALLRVRSLVPLPSKPEPVVEAAPSAAIERVPLPPKLREVVAQARKEVLPPAEFVEPYSPLGLVPPEPVVPPVLISLMVAAPEQPPPPPVYQVEQEVRVQVMPIFITVGEEREASPPSEEAEPASEPTREPLDREFFEMPIWWEIFKSEQSRKHIIHLVAATAAGLATGAALTLLAGRRAGGKAARGSKADEKAPVAKKGGGPTVPSLFKGGKGKAHA